MISFPCPFCDMKVEAPGEFAGRRARCPECNEAVEVPRGAEAGGQVGEGTESIVHPITVDGATKRYTEDEMDKLAGELGVAGFESSWPVGKKLDAIAKQIDLKDQNRNLAEFWQNAPDDLMWS